MRNDQQSIETSLDALTSHVHVGNNLVEPTEILSQMTMYFSTIVDKANKLQQNTLIIYAGRYSRITYKR